MVSRQSTNGQGMVKRLRQKNERSPQFGQRAVELQGLADCGHALIADLVVKETVATGKSAHCQELVKGKSGDDQGITRKASVYLRVVSAPLNFRPSAIAVAP
eukprot:6507810-Prymnesium_polylepis.1